MSQNNESQVVEETEDASEEDVYSIGLFFWEIVKVCTLAFVIIIPIRMFFFQPFFVQGTSMEPNFEDGQYLIIGELGYKKTDVNVFGNELFSVDPSKELKRQEITVFHPPTASRSDQFFIKRVIGLPGETVEIKDNQVVIYNDEHPYPNGLVLDESAYLDSSVITRGPGGATAYSVRLKDDEYFLMGDNRSHSHDSRAFGPVTKDHITGRVLLRAWPVNKSTLY